MKKGEELWRSVTRYYLYRFCNGTVSVISSEPRCKDGTVKYNTTVQGTVKYNTTVQGTVKYNTTVQGTVK